MSLGHIMGVRLAPVTSTSGEESEAQKDGTEMGADVGAVTC